MQKSPCVRQCCLDQHDCCLGCGRSLDEILKWQQATEAERLHIMQLARQRLEKAAQFTYASRGKPF